MKQKRFLKVLLCVSAASCLMLGGCGTGKKTEEAVTQKAAEAPTETVKTEEVTTKAPEKNTENSYEEVDIDLTAMSSTMVYAEVYNMVTEPEQYIGKTVRMNGAFSVYQDPDTGKCYFACIIKDATACCEQGMEFRLRKHMTYPNDYPEQGTELNVVGVFNTYEEDGSMYCELQDAVMTY